MNRKVRADFPFESLVNPRALTIIATHHCTSACKSCCFNCSPVVDTSLELNSIIRIIDSCVTQFPQLQVLVLTGGEILSLDFNFVKQILCHAKEKRLITRIVSNGFWAADFDETHRILTELTNAGLDEINISTGDEHLKFVPVENLLNIAKCAEHIDSLKTCLFVVEKGEKKRFSKNELLERLHSFGNFEKTAVMESPWVDLENKSVDFQEEIICKTNKFHHPADRGCKGLYNSIQISPMGQILSCCGFAAEYSPLLKMGDFFSNRDLYNLFLKHTNDLLKLWLYLDGPLGVFEYFNPGKTLSTDLHQCEICSRLLSNPKYLKGMASLNSLKVQDILLRLQIKLQSQNNNNNETERKNHSAAIRCIE